MTIIVTGGAGFIGANFVRRWLECSDEPVVTLDKLTYAGNADNLEPFLHDPRHRLIEGDIGDFERMKALLGEVTPRAIVNFAAESHVDRSIAGPAAFIATNVNGTFTLLEAARQYLKEREAAVQGAFRFLQVSTDEVYGSLAADQLPCDENQPYAPNSPYSASKAAADHLVRAYFHTYGMQTLATNCSNNYGPLQFPEKFIPVVIERALSGSPIPIYGDGLNVRDWLHVSDHCSALRLILANGRPGETYNIGAGNEVTNVELAVRICGLLDELAPLGDKLYAELISYVADRPGHDRRYAIDAGKLRRETGWQAVHSLDAGLRDTVRWYLDNREWTSAALARATRLR